MKLLAPALLFLCTVQPSPAQEYTTQSERDWTLVKATQGTGCFATIDVGLKATGSGLVTIALYPRGKDEAVPAVMTVQVPLGASLPSGIAYTHRQDGEAIGLAWQYCTQRTCVASGGVSSGELERLKRGNRIYLGFVPLPGSAPLITPISLFGITKIWNDVQACG